MTQTTKYSYLALTVFLASGITILGLRCARPVQITEPNGIIINRVIQDKGTIDRFDAGRSIAELTDHQLREHMESFGFRNLNELRYFELRRVYIAYAYRPMYQHMSELTNLPEEVIFAYHIFEATLHAIETDLFAVHKNPGGIKYRGIGYPVKWYDDCTDSNGKSIPCTFEGFKNYQDMLEAWSAVFNANRYKSCKDYRRNLDVCKCLQQNGYHTGNTYRQRARLAWSYRYMTKYFPV